MISLIRPSHTSQDWTYPCMALLMLATLSASLVNVYFIIIDEDSDVVGASFKWLSRSNHTDFGLKNDDPTTSLESGATFSNGNVTDVFSNGSDSTGGGKTKIKGAEEDDDSDDFKEKLLVRLLVKAWEEKYTIEGNESPSEEVDDGDGDDGDHGDMAGDGHGSAASKRSRRSLGREEKRVVEELVSVRPPHVSDCEQEEKQVADFDRRKSDGSLPQWAAMDDGSNLRPGPHPPWIQGPDEDNLPRTRVVQRDIWLHQHPVNCSDPSVRFAIGSWWHLDHGIGSQLHGMTALLGEAMRVGRVLVFSNNYVRANHKNCTGDLRNRLACYFVSITSAECSKRAAMLLAEQKRTNWRGSEEEKPVSFWEGWVLNSHRLSIPSIWGDGAEAPWAHMSPSVVLGDTLVDDGAVGWWRAQALRYILRWPTKYICGITNRIRNRSFGPMVAREMLGSITRLKNASLYSSDAKTEAEGHVGTVDTEETKARLRTTGLIATWQRRSTVDQGKKLFVPNPLMSIHVRLGVQKMTEMTLFGLATYMRIAEVIREQDGGLKNVWLSTEVKSVIDESNNYTAWSFFYSHQKRIQENQPDFDNELSHFNGSHFNGSHFNGSHFNGSHFNGGALLPNFMVVEKAFANLLISSEADYFIGALGSNWCRLIDELRKTNGRASRRYIAMNYGQW